MARSVPKVTETLPLVRGDKWDGLSVTFLRTAFDFTGMQAKVQLRVQSDDTLVAEPTPSTLVPALGQLIVTFGLPGAVTSLFPLATIRGDVTLYRTAPAFGPKTWLRFSFNCVGNINEL